MKAKCIKLTYMHIENRPAPMQNFEFLEDYSDILKLEMTYSVYAISVWQNKVFYLLDMSFAYANKRIKPEWCPADIFEIIDSSLPKETYFGYFGFDDKRGLSALWGYDELINDYNHYIDLIELEELALYIFQKRVQEIDSNL